MKWRSNKRRVPAGEVGDQKIKPNALGHYVEVAQVGDRHLMKILRKGFVSRIGDNQVESFHLFPVPCFPPLPDWQSGKVRPRHNFRIQSSVRISDSREVS